MSSEWKRQASVWFQEHKLAVSLIGIIISCFMSYVGIISQWYSAGSTTVSGAQYTVYTSANTGDIVTCYIRES